VQACLRAQALSYGRIAKYGNMGLEWHSAFASAFETTKRGNDGYTEHEVFGSFCMQLHAQHKYV
jgi:hypothetical protein